MGGNNRSSRKRRFGNVRKLPSGRWQARYTGPDGQTRKAPKTFGTQRSAERWLVEQEAEMLRGEWLDPNAATVPLVTYVERWIRERDLKPRTREEYARVARLHIVPHLGNYTLDKLTAQHIRTWYATLRSSGTGRSTITKAYRILHAALATAADDELIRRNPCRIKRAGQDKADERPTATLDQVFSIAAAIQPRYRLIVLLATFAQLRFGELVGLTRRSINLETMELRVNNSTTELEDGTQIDDDPKSQAGKRPITLPKGLRADIELHLSRYAQPGSSGRLFVGPHGGIPRRRNFNRIWKNALAAAGIPAELDLHFHDLRHTGSTWSAHSGATLKELMARIGHSSTRAALIYQHASRERDQAIADALDRLINEARSAPRPAVVRSGKDVAHRRATSTR